jgi:hypothetical protein
LLKKTFRLKSNIHFWNVLTKNIKNKNSIYN